MLFFYCLFWHVFIYGCNSISTLNALNQASSLYSSEPAYSGTSNQSITDSALNEWHKMITAIRDHNKDLIKEIFFDTHKELKESDNNYIAKISMLKIQDEERNTLLHSIAEKGYHNFLKFILRYLYACSSKNLESIKENIKEILSIENKKSCTVLHTAIINNHRNFIKVLLDSGYISKDNAEDAIFAALKFAKHPANNSVKLLQEYIENKDNRNAILENSVQTTIINQDNDLAEEDNNINDLINNEKSIYLYRTTPLHTFAKDKNNGIVATMRYLNLLTLKKKIEEVYYTRNKKGLTPFTIALIDDHLHFVKFLLKHINAPKEILYNSIKWATTNAGTWKKKKTFASQDMIALLRYYDRQNSKKIRYTVNGCKKDCANRSNLSQHIKSFHNDKRTICTVNGCKKNFANRSSLSQHIRSFHNSERTLCTIQGCNKDFANRSNLSQHIKNIHNGKRIPCTIQECNKDFANRSNLSQHIKNIHNGKRIPCTIQGCNKDFVNRSNLYRHIKSVHNALTTPS